MLKENLKQFRKAKGLTQEKFALQLKDFKIFAAGSLPGFFTEAVC